MFRMKRIMVVDDEPGIRNLLFDVLSGEGFNVSLASDGKDSLSQMKKKRFDLVITDINMPRLDGIELLKRMKKAGRKEKVIVMSGNSFKRADYKKEIPPIVDQLHKPFRLKNFLDTVALALGPENGKKINLLNPARGKERINAV